MQNFAQIVEQNKPKNKNYIESIGKTELKLSIKKWCECQESYYKSTNFQWSETFITKHTYLVCQQFGIHMVVPAYKDVAKSKYLNVKIVELIYRPEAKNLPEYI